MSVKGKPILLKVLLSPFAMLYGLVVTIRNWMFDNGLLPSVSYGFPVICVGNITVGGTGKTPFTEYLVRLLQNRKKVGVLSRGYKRSTSGYILSTKYSKASEIGDEPCQIKRKFPDVVLAVDADRRRGITKMRETERPDVILLDDAYQHRYVKPGLSILLIDYNRLVTEDSLLPMGNLREPVRSKNRAQIVVVNKCPSSATPMDLRIIKKKLGLYPYQTLYFSSIAYGDFIPVFSTCCIEKELMNPEALKREGYSVLCVTGIASPKPLEDYIASFAKEVISLPFGDHHNFTKSDMLLIEKQFNSITSSKKLILTTEKDAVRLQESPFLSEEMKRVICSVPLTVRFLNDAESFNKQILDYVGKDR